MKDNKFAFDINSFRIFYFTYKEYIIPSSFIFLSLILFIFVIFPQFRDYKSMQDQTKEVRGKIERLSANIKTLDSSDQNAEAANYQTSILALPSEKDYIGVLQAISKTSADAQVSVGDFSFLVGDLSSKVPDTQGQPSFNLSLTVTGDINQVKRFMQALYKASPVAQISAIQIGDNSATLQVAFYYKALPQRIQVAFDQPLPVLTQKDKGIIEDFRSNQ